MNANAALKLIRDHGVLGLCESDGCLCIHFEIQGVNVDVSCRKSSVGGLPFDREFYGTVVRVHSRHLDSSIIELQPIADEIVKQVAGYDGRPIAVRFCDWAYDRPPRCAYCGEPRADLNGYLCAKHQDVDKYWTVGQPERGAASRPESSRTE